MSDKLSEIIIPPHGGDLVWASTTFGHKRSEWLDLSTGISPWGYPIASVPDYCWHSLPYDTSDLLEAAASYYQCPVDAITAVAGSQDAVRRLPSYLAPAVVAMPQLGYREHTEAWQQADHSLRYYSNFDELLSLVVTQQVDHVLVINPNNPTAEWTDKEQLLSLQRTMKNHGMLIIDEAFMDGNQQHSLSSYVGDNSIIVLRSVGKFFGLAGLRLGFVLGSGQLVSRLRQEIGPWPVNFPGAWIGARALTDSPWQEQQSLRLRQQVDQLLKQLDEMSECQVTATDLFVTLLGSVAILKPLYLAAADAGILLRYDQYSEQQAWLRIGLPGDDWPRLVSFIKDYRLRLKI